MPNVSEDRGPQIWESPSKDAPKLLLGLIGGLFLAFGIALTLFSPGLWSPHIDQTEEGRRVTFGLIGVTGVFGAFLIFRAFFPSKILGVQFFTRGVEYGPMSKRRYIPYLHLERFSLEPIPVSLHQLNDGVALARFILSVVAENPGGIAYNLGKLYFKKVDSFVVIKPRGEKEFRIAVFKDAKDKLAFLFTAQRT
jgi:hypothetical protein